MAKIVFANRKVKYPNRFILKENASDSGKYVNLIRDSGTIQTKGTVLNAENVNTAISEKQNELTAGGIISINNDVVSLTQTQDYSMFSSNLSVAGTSGAAVYDADYKLWTLNKKSAAVTANSEYLVNIDDANIKYKFVKAAFDVGEIELNSASANNPAVVVKFQKSTAAESLYIVLDIKTRRAKLMNGAGETIETSSGYMMPTNPFSSFARVEVKRTALNGHPYYLVRSGDYSCSFTVTDGTYYDNILIGTIGSKATVKNWIIDGSVI